MKPKRSRLTTVAPAAALFMIFSLTSVPSAPSVPDPTTAFEPAEAQTHDPAQDALARWLTGIPGNDEGGFQGLSGRDLAAAIRAEPRSLELFEKSSGSEATRRFLEHVPFGDRIFRVASRYRLDSLLLTALVETESSFDPGAVSPQGAMGLTQVMPDTARSFGSHDLLNPAVNLDVGARYFSSLLERFGGDVELALAAYNAGPATVSRYGGVPPFRETRRYVDRVLSLYLDHHHRVWESARDVARRSDEGAGEEVALR
jgi:soluble lytic murein transglycosylase-like protein